VQAKARTESTKEAILQGVNEFADGVAVAGLEIASAGIGHLTKGVRKVRTFVEGLNS